MSDMTDHNPYGDLDPETNEKLDRLRLLRPEKHAELMQEVDDRMATLAAEEEEEEEDR